MRNQKEKDSEATQVSFRMWKGQVIALFPYEIADNRGSIQSYMRLGQHSAADYHHIVANSRPATPIERNALKEELESIGYNLQIISRYSHQKYLDAYYDVKNMAA